MIISFLKKYILPKEVDFIKAIQIEALQIKNITDNLYECFIHGKKCQDILNNQKKASDIKDKNMKELLNVFITPIDRESIYRVITQLDWISLSIKHLYLEINAYEIKNLKEFEHILKILKLQAKLLTDGFKYLNKDNIKTAKLSKEVRDNYDKLVEIYIKEMANLTKKHNIKEIFTKKEILHQLKDISKRMRITANSLEDIVMKMA